VERVDEEAAIADALVGAASIVERDILLDEIVLCPDRPVKHR